PTANQAHASAPVQMARLQLLHFHPARKEWKSIASNHQSKVLLFPTLSHSNSPIQAPSFLIPYFHMFGLENKEVNDSAKIFTKNSCTIDENELYLYCQNIASDATF